MYMYEGKIMTLRSYNQMYFPDFLFSTFELIVSFNDPTMFALKKYTGNIL